MKTKSFIVLFVLFSAMAAKAQNVLTPELLWKLGRVSGKGISKDGKYVIYSVGTPDIAANKVNTKDYAIPLAGGASEIVTDVDARLANDRISPDGKYKISSRDVKVIKVTGSDYYPDLKKKQCAHL